MFAETIFIERKMRQNVFIYMSHNLIDKKLRCNKTKFYCPFMLSFDNDLEIKYHTKKSTTLQQIISMIKTSHDNESREPCD